MILFKRILVLTLLVIALACEDEDVHPDIDTVSVTAISAGSFTVVGNFAEVGNIPVEEYGFVYGYYSTPELGSGTKVVMTSDPARGNYVTTVDISYTGSYYEFIYVRAFITNARGTAYGKVIKVNFPQLTVSTILPQAASPGEEIEISGSSFSLEPTANKVRFNSTYATVVSATSTKLTVEVPSGISSTYYYDSYVDVYVEVGGQQRLATEYFIVKPVVNSFSPSSGTFGTYVTINGSFFVTGYSSNYSVTVGDQGASISNVSASQISFVVPNSVNESTSQVKLYFLGSAVDVGTFTLVAPGISSISCEKAYNESQVVVYGSGFNPTYYSGYNTATIGGVSASIVNWSAEHVTCVVPSTLAEGNYDIEIYNGVASVTYDGQLSIVDWSVSNLSANTAVRGSVVRINGDFPTCEFWPQVSLGSWGMSVVSKSEEYLDVEVYPWMNDGTFQMTLSIGEKSVVVTESFSVTYQ